MKDEDKKSRMVSVNEIMIEEFPTATAVNKEIREQGRFSNGERNHL